MSVSKISGDSSEARACCGLRGMGLRSIGESEGSCLMTNLSEESVVVSESVVATRGRGRGSTAEAAAGARLLLLSIL